jgi:cytochrome c-type biogenesis protein CcmH/NrfG
MAPALYVMAALAPAAGVRAQPAEPASPDVLYAQREDYAKAQAAASAWMARLKTAQDDYESAWKLARADYWLGTHEAGHRAYLEAGLEAARTAIRLQPKRPEGHFWLAANMGALAESFGVRQGIKYRRPVREALEEIIRIDPTFLGGAADRALGRWYFKVPGLFGGSNSKSVEHLRRALKIDPNSTVSWYFLAETLLDMGRKGEARDALQHVLDAPVTAEWAPEDREWKTKARALMPRTS